MPSIWEIEFAGIDPNHVRSSGIHHFLSAWFCETDPEHRSLKGYSIGNRVNHEHGVRIEIRCVDDRLADLVAAIPSGQPVQFGTTFARTALVLVPPRCVAGSSWENLSRYRGTTQWRLSFRTPTVVRHHQIDQPWPAPHPVLRGLQAKWDAWGPTIVPAFDNGTAAQVTVTGADLRTEQTRQAPIPLWGATGAVEWTWARPRPRRSDAGNGVEVVERLLGLAQFSGIGSYTQHGLGLVEISGRRAETGKPRAA
ncbi:MAG: CRISPR system precrRNA processing endoribonuclease RAMP protein Cas6 [Micropruina sp.]|nr:MAG: CRISPR system precrRNA processing endoribonuclease RAMP protein Cas6 [Micropruina sp.]